MNTVASTAAGTRTLRRGAVAVPRAPRRVSGPVRPQRRGPAAPTFADRITGVADAPVLDRLIRGRAWIAVIGVMLMGLVFVQVSMLRLNTGIGRDVATAAQLERDNQQLRNTVAELGSGDRIETAAAKLGMVMPGAGQVHYVHAGDASAATAAQAISAPAPVVQQPAAGATSDVSTADTAGQTTLVTPQTAAPTQTTAPTQTATPTPTPVATPQTTTATPTATTAATGGAAPTP